MKKIYFLLFIVVATWLASCKSASKLYQKGNYDEAVQVAVKKLQKDPNDPKLKSVVQDAYRYAVTDHESRIRNYSSMDNEMKWEWMYNEYSNLQSLHNVIFKAPSVYELVRPKDYSSDINANASKASDVHYNRGMELMNDNNKQSFKNAYREFKTAIALDPNFALAHARLAQIHTRIAIFFDPSPVHKQRRPARVGRWSIRRSPHLAEIVSCTCTAAWLAGESTRFSITK